MRSPQSEVAHVLCTPLKVLGYRHANSQNFRRRKLTETTEADLLNFFVENDCSHTNFFHQRLSVTSERQEADEAWIAPSLFKSFHIERQLHTHSGFDQVTLSVSPGAHTESLRVTKK